MKDNNRKHTTKTAITSRKAVSVARQSQRASRNLLKERARTLFTFSAIIGLAFASCVRDFEDGETFVIENRDSARFVTLSLAAPRNTATRAATPGSAAENRVEEVDALLFTASDKFYYRAIGEIVDDDLDNNSSKATQEYRVKLPFGTFNVVVIANARAEIDGATGANAMPIATIDASGTKDRAALLNSIEWSAAGKIAKADGFPMHGAKENVTISATSTSISTSSNPLQLARAAARVDVSVQTNDFTLSSVSVYNRSVKGRVAPAAAVPNVPGGTIKTASPLLYDNADGLSTAGISESIYLFESSVEADWAANTCLVIKGKYKGGADSYYRVDFIKKESNGAHVHVPLLRNCLYSVVISAAEADGWSSESAALANKPSNLVADIVNDKDLNIITFNEHYFLAVDRDEINFYKEGREKKVFVLTDYPLGWTVDNVPAWLGVAPLASAPPNHAEVGLLTLTAQTLGAGSREGQFRVAAGNLEKWITVKQTSEGEFSLVVEPEELLYYKTPVTREISVDPFPTGGSNNITFVSSPVFGAWTPALPTNRVAAKENFNLKPSDNNAIGAVTRRGSLLVTLSDGSRSITRVIAVAQLARDIFDVALNNPYPTAAGDYQFTVVSDIPWKLSENAVPLALLENEDDYHLATPARPYSFSLTKATGYGTRRFTVNVTCDASAFSPTPHVPASFEIEQLGWTPLLEITAPAANDQSKHVHDFIQTAEQKLVTLSTNAPWKILSITGDADVATPSITVDATQNSSSNPEVSTTQYVTFTPSTSNKDYRFKVLTSTVTFSTVTDADSEATKVLTLKRTVPILFNLLGYREGSSGDLGEPANVYLSPTKTTMEFFAETNTPWQVKIGTPRTQSVTGYEANSKITVPFDALSPTDAASWKLSSNTFGYVLYNHVESPTTNTTQYGQAFNIYRNPYTITATVSDITGISAKLSNIVTDANDWELKFMDGGSTLFTIEETDYSGSPLSLILPQTATDKTITVVDRGGKTVTTFTQPSFSQYLLAGPVTSVTQYFDNLTCPPPYELYVSNSYGDLDARYVATAPSLGDLLIVGSQGTPLVAGITAISGTDNSRTLGFGSSTTFSYGTTLSHPAYYVCVLYAEE